MMHGAYCTISRDFICLVDSVPKDRFTHNPNQIQHNKNNGINSHSQDTILLQPHLFVTGIRRLLLMDIYHSIKLLSTSRPKTKHKIPQSSIKLSYVSRHWYMSKYILTVEVCAECYKNLYTTYIALISHAPSVPKTELWANSTSDENVIIARFWSRDYCAVTRISRLFSKS